MVDAAARVLALCNQLIFLGKSVSIDFTACSNTRIYLRYAPFITRVPS